MQATLCKVCGARHWGVCSTKEAAVPKPVEKKPAAKKPAAKKKGKTNVKK